jgi:KDO2-lipid IV(A) lauroyltransferase
VEDKKLITANLKRVLNAKGQNPTEEILGEKVKEVYVNFGKFLVEFFKFKIDKEFIDKKVTVEDKKNILDKLRHDNQGAIVLSAHLGNWEIAAAVVNKLGFKVNAITRPHTSRIVTNFFDNSREARGVKVVPLGVAIKRCFEALKKNEMISFLGDKDFSGGGVRVNFMNEEAIVPKGPAVFSLKTEVPVVFIYLIREKNDDFRLIIDKLIYPGSHYDKEDDIKKLTQQYIYSLKEYIKEYPTQWLMFHKIWES